MPVDLPPYHSEFTAECETFDCDCEYVECTDSNVGVTYDLFSCFMKSFEETSWVTGEPVRYIVPTYITVPKGVEWPMPLLVMMHNLSYDRRLFVYPPAPPETHEADEWNARTFAKRGYAVLTLTARGHFDSPSSLRASELNPEAKYWYAQVDPRREVRDAQVMIGKLVDAGLADPDRIAVTGNSLGGICSWWFVLQNGKVELEDGSLDDWKSSPTKEYPGGRPLSICAAVPMQPAWTSFAYSMMPNGRMKDDKLSTKEELNCPLGVLLEAWWDLLHLALPIYVDYAPPNVDPTADFQTWYARVKAGDPYDIDYTDGVCTRSDPVVQQMVDELDRRSYQYITPNSIVPVYQVYGLTDTIAHGHHGVQMIRKLRSEDDLNPITNPDYPIKSFFGNMHHTTGAAFSHWQRSQEIGYEFLDYYMLDKGTEPTFDVTIATIECGDNVCYEDSVEFVAPDWESLANNEVVFQSSNLQTTINPSPKDEPFFPSSIELGWAAGDQLNCYTVPATEAGGFGYWDFTQNAPFTLIGAPELNISFNTTGEDVQLNGILWQLEPGGTEKTLVAYGAYRHIWDPNPIGDPETINYQLNPNAWQFDAGTTLRLEVRSDARPHFKPNNAPATTEINSVTLSIPGRCNSCLADLNCDGIVNVNDLLLLISIWGTTSAIGDLNLSGSINVDDLLILIGAWGPCS